MYNFKVASQAELQAEVLAGFTNGMNVVDDDSQLSADTPRLQVNARRAHDGRLRVRHGCELAADLSAEFDDIIGIEYFSGYLIVVNADGRIAACTEDGDWNIIWSEFIANGLSGSPHGWGGCSFISFAQFKETLIICNGIDKPVAVDAALIVSYVADPATGSNVNVPRAAYVVASQNYCLYAGDPFDPTILYITSKGTSNVFQGDAGSDGTNIDMGVYVRLGSAVIRGLSPFRGNVVIGFDKQYVVATLGVYVSADHRPSFSDTIENYGLLNQSCIVASGDDVIFADIMGISTLTRTIFTGLIQPSKLSRNIEPIIVPQLASLSDNILATWPFMVYNGRDTEFILYAPNLPDNREVYETTGYVLSADREKRVNAWAIYKGMMWSCGCTTRLQRLYYARAGYIFRMGSDAQPIRRDHEGWEEMFSDDTTFTDGRGFATTDPAATYKHGVSIEFDYISTWFTMGRRRNMKKTKYFGIETDGEARFTVEHFVDSIFFKRNDFGEPFTDDTIFSDGMGWAYETPPYDPALSMEFVGGEAYGFGGSPYGDAYGDGRITNDERLFAWTVKGNRHKLRVHGYAIEGLGISSMSLLYRTGSIRR